MRNFILRALAAALGLWLASAVVPGIHIEGLATLLLAALLLGVVNALVRPIVVVLTLPLTILTLGLFLLVVNAAMLGLVAWFLGGMTIAGLWPALLGAVIISLTTWVVSQVVDRR